MADSIPSLRRKLDEANAEIARLKDVVSNRPVKVVDRIVERVVKVEVPVYRTRYIEYPTVEYIENPQHLRMIEELQGKLEAWRAISQSDS